jgi:hypothetical protein
MQIDENSTEGTTLWSISIIDSEYTCTYKIVFQRLMVLEVDHWIRQYIVLLCRHDSHKGIYEQIHGSCISFYTWNFIEIKTKPKKKKPVQVQNRQKEKKQKFSK